MMKTVALVCLGHVLPLGGGGGSILEEGRFRPTPVEEGGFDLGGCVWGVMSGHREIHFKALQ